MATMAKARKDENSMKNLFLTYHLQFGNYPFSGYSAKIMTAIISHTRLLSSKDLRDKY